MLWRCASTGVVLALVLGLTWEEPVFPNQAQEFAAPDEFGLKADPALDLLAAQLPRQDRIDRMQMPPPPRAILEIYHVAFDPKWVPLEVGRSIGIYVAFTNKGPPGSTTSEFRIYLSRDGHVLEKRRPSLSGGLRAGRASSTKFDITLPNQPGRYCWEVSLRQTDDGRMTLGDPKTICALLKTKPRSGLMKRNP